MISTASSCPASTDLAWRILMAAALGLLLCTSAQARKSDRSQPINVYAKSFDSSAKPDGITHLKGDVVITQGTLKATSDRATVHFDGQSQIKRVVLVGQAHIQQVDDHGNRMTGEADSIDYDVPAGIATLTGHAHVAQAGRGSASGNTLVYDTRNSTMTGKGTADNRVHLVFKARQQPAAAASAPPAPAKGH